MSTPHKCPKCDGKGWLLFDPQMPYATASTSSGPWKCDVCQEGVLWSPGTHKAPPSYTTVTSWPDNMPPTVVLGPGVATWGGKV